MEPTIDDAETPTRLIAGRYLLGDVLGTGGMSVVHDAFDERLQRPVAVKCLRGEMARRDDVRSRFETEARWAARLEHPHAVGVYDTGEHDGVPFLVMERLPGETLADRIARGPVDEAWLRRIAVEVLGALGAAHDAGIVHRDVKPGNILLTTSGHAKVADFGIAKSLGLDDDKLDLTRTGQLIGTPSYLAPERLDGTAATPQSDLYSLGAVLYEALGGRKAYSGPDALAVAYAIKHEPLVPLAELRPDADAAFVAVIERAMAKGPDRRFRSAREMADALQDAPTVVTRAAAATVEGGDRTVVLTGAPVPRTAAPPPAAEAAVRRGGKGWLVLAAVLVLGVLFAAGLALGARDDGGVTGAGDPALAEELRDVAARIEVGDGARGPEAAARLREIADKVEAGEDAGDQATSLYRDAATWHDERLLFDRATALTLEVLKKVPGVEVTETAPTAVTTPSADDGAGVNVGVQLGGDDDDDRDRGRGKGGKGRD